MGKGLNFKFILAILICQAAGLIGSVFTSPKISTWYADLARPRLNPPNWIFGPVWVMLFVLMGIALYLVWSKGIEKKKTKQAMAVFGIQLVLNIAWSIIFFGLQNPGVALIELVVLWFAILWTGILFYKISKPAALLLLPYILWVSFAGYLNYSIWTLNKVESAACAMDAKLCSDGSYVSRIAPECNFAQCPKEEKTLQ